MLDKEIVLDVSCKSIRDILERRGDQYGYNAVGEVASILTQLFPEGVDPEEFRELVCIVHICVKLVRYSKAVSEGEVTEDSALDLAGYAGILNAVEHDKSDDMYEEYKKEIAEIARG